MTQAFNLSQLANRINTSGQLDASTGLYNQTPVANGGTGKSTVTTGALLLGAGTSAMTELTGTTPGTVVSSSPTGWTSVPAASVAGGDYIMQSYTSPNVWTKPSTLKAVKVTVVGGGGNGGGTTAPTPAPIGGAGAGGGGGGSAILYLDASAIPGPITITAGAGTNSFGPLVSATGGSNGGAGTSPNVNSLARGAGGTGSGSGAINFVGTPGGSSVFESNNNRSWGGAGGTSAIFAATTPAPTTIGSAGAPNTINGGGGSGSPYRQTPGTSVGGTGAPGIVIVEEFY